MRDFDDITTRNEKIRNTILHSAQDSTGPEAVLADGNSNTVGADIGAMLDYLEKLKEVQDVLERRLEPVLRSMPTAMTPVETPKVSFREQAYQELHDMTRPGGIAPMQELIEQASWMLHQLAAGQRSIMDRLAV